MACRHALDITNLQGCFSNAASIKIFEDKRREALVRADEAYNIHTMTHATPILREYRRAITMCSQGVDIVRQLENTVDELETVLSEAMREGKTGKALQRIRAELKSTVYETKQQFYELVEKPRRAASRYISRLMHDSTVRLELQDNVPFAPPPAELSLIHISEPTRPY